MTRRSWTHHEILELDELVHAGLSDHIIAGRLGRSYDSVKIARRRKLGLRSGNNYKWCARSIMKLLGLTCSKTVTYWIREGFLEARRSQRGRSDYLPMWRVSEASLTQFLQDSSYWHLWDVERVTDPDWRAWLTELRGGATYYTAGEVARMFHVQRETVSAWVYRGYLPAGRLGYNYRIAKSDLEGFVPPGSDSKAGMSVTRWTEAETTMLLELRRSGMSWREIGIALGRSMQSVANKHSRCVQREERVAA